MVLNKINLNDVNVWIIFYYWYSNDEKELVLYYNIFKVVCNIIFVGVLFNLFLFCLYLLNNFFVIILLLLFLLLVLLNNFLLLMSFFLIIFFNIILFLLNSD